MPHGVLELSCIVVAGAAGLRIGWALVDPGTLDARRSRCAARPGAAMEIVLGTMPWLVLAGLVEGFVRRADLGAGRLPSSSASGSASLLGAGALARAARAAQSRARALARR